MLLLALPALVGLSVLGFVLVQTRGGSQFEACATSSPSFIPTTSYGDFAVIVDQKLTASADGRVGIGPALGGFVGGRLHGSINAVALRPPFRAEEDAQARAENDFTVGPFPLVPLTGNVVRATSGLLEVYESHLVYSEKGTAEQALVTFRASNTSDPLNPSEFLSTAVGPTDIVVDIERGASPDQETDVRVGFVIGTIFESLSFQGGSQTNGALVAMYVHASEVRVAQACGI